jgi:hypothetical protein
MALELRDAFERGWMPRPVEDWFFRPIQANSEIKGSVPGWATAAEQIEKRDHLVLGSMDLHVSNPCSSLRSWRFNRFCRSKQRPSTKSVQ